MSTLPADVNDLAAAALDYAARGLAVHPVSVTKRPLTAHGRLEATIDPERITAWWSRWPRAAIAAPVPPGVVVLDRDPRNDGDATLDTLASRGLVLPPTLTARTGGGGAHRWFVRPAGIKLRKNLAALPGLDLLGSTSSVILPPSRHRAGARYQWTDDAPMAPLPPWLAHRFRPPETGRRRPLSLTTPEHVEGLLARQLDRVRSAPNGSRNDTLRASAWFAGRMVGAGLLHEDHATDALIDAALSVGLDHREASTTVRHGLTDGARDPLPRRNPCHQRRASPSSHS